MSDNGTVLIVETTAPDDATANMLTAELVGRRLAACVQRSEIRSTYRWEGEIESSEEVLLRIKTSDASRDAVVTAIEELHPYEVPEIVVIAAAAGGAYGEWVDGETGPPA